jgi:deoxycytidine triphosphate deaminase
MAIKSDRWITRMAKEHGMIEPFSDRQVREGVVSYGVSSYGYDVRIADDFKIFTNINSTVIDPKDFDSRSFVDFRGDVCVIPPNSFALARTVEYFRIPRNVLVVCLGKCLAGDTEVVDGSTGALRAISDYGPGEAATASLARGSVRKSHVSEGTATGVLPTFEITTRTGRRLRATPNHPLMTFEGWRAVQELPIGSRIGVPRRVAVFGDREMPEWEIDLLGFFLSDGTCATPGASPGYTSGDPVLREAFSEAVRRFGGVPRPHTAMSVRATNRGRRGGLMEPNRFYAWLKRLGMAVKSPDKVIPSCVFELRQPLQARFLRALFSGDGGISRTGTSVHLEFTSTSERMARQVHHLLLRFGVVAILRHRETASGRGAWCLSITSKEHVARFADTIGFFPGSRKQQRLAEAIEWIQDHPFRKSNYDTLPAAAWAVLGDACRARGTSMNAMGVHPSTGQSVPRSIVRDLGERLSHDMLGAMADSDVLWDTVVRKRFTGFEPVYDLTVPEYSNFMANDFVVHNSTYARCGIIVNVTPLEPEWEGIVTLEVSNTTPLPAKIYANEGIAQMLFFESDEPCEVSYADKKGKYQKQAGLTLPKM